MNRNLGRWLVLALLAGAVAWTVLSFNHLGEGVRVGEPLPLPALPRWGGGTLDPAALRGRPVLIRLSSRACTFCSNDFQVLEAIQARYGTRLAVVAVEVESGATELDQALAGFQPSYPILLDGDGRGTAGWPVKSLPSLILLDRTGRASRHPRGRGADRGRGQAGGAALPTPPVPGSARFHDQFREVALQIRCQECEGLSVWESDATSAWIARAEIEARLVDGWTPDEIVHWFEDRYGLWILMSPPARGGLRWVWLAPWLVLLAGSGLAWRYLARRAMPVPQGPDPEAAEPLPDEVARRLREYL